MKAPFQFERWYAFLRESEQAVAQREHRQKAETVASVRQADSPATEDSRKFRESSSAESGGAYNVSTGTTHNATRPSGRLEWRGEWEYSTPQWRHLPELPPRQRWSPG